jgi:hypothetical protein
MQKISSFKQLILLFELALCKEVINPRRVHDFNQGCGSGSGFSEFVDPDPYRESGTWILILDPDPWVRKLSGKMYFF